MTLGSLFLRFLRFGLLAWGGPAAQIAMIRRDLVERERWIDGPRFNRVLAVYQALPGPEAAELCCYFGMVKRGRIGSVVAGLGFVLPGLVLMLAASWLYVRYGLTAPLVVAAFAGVQPAVAALIAHAAVHLARKVLTARWLIACAATAAIGPALGVNFWIGLIGAALAGALRTHSRTASWTLIAATATVSISLGIQARATITEPPLPRQSNQAAPATRSTRTTNPTQLFLATGLKAGLLTFGGAYTAIPVVQHSAVYSNPPTGAPSGWMTHDQFLDALAVGGVLPAPLVIFCTFVGFIGAGWTGALLMTLGVFAPAFSFTLIGHRAIERLVDDARWHAALDAVAAAVVGLLCVAAVETAVQTIAAPWQAAVFLGAWAALATLKRRWMVPAVIAAAAAAGTLV